ncbi:MAG: hypothetical protein E7555_09210 [Ruminococcaceae bacterium]|nr:hypothetical protein [Oscillospiraceae bacterium]
MKIFTFLRNFIFEFFHIVIAFVLLIPFVATLSEDNSSDWEIYVNESGTNPYITEYGQVDIAAHRGGGGNAPQNTMMAIEMLVKEKENTGADIAEFDVQLTKDGKLVLIHDLTYDNLSDATEFFGRENISVNSLTYEQARQLNMGERFKLNGEKPYKGLRGDAIPDNLRIPLCDDVMKYIEENCTEDKFNYLIEVKAIGTDSRKATDELYKLIEKYNLKGRVMWSTFDPFLSGYMEKNYPEIPRSANALEAVQFIFYARMDWNFDITGATYEALQVPYGSSALNGFINTGTREFLNYAHKNNIAVQYWTINDESEISYLVNNGADCIITDFPERISQYS